MSKPSITLFRGWDEPGKYVWSPFTTKLEFRLRTSRTPYTRAIGTLSAAPKGKIPYISLTSDSGSTETIGDTSLIIRHLVASGLVPDVNARLSATEKSVDLALRAMLEDKLYFLGARERWVKNYYAMRDYALWAIPYPLRVVIGLLAQRGNVKKLYDQGVGRFSDEEIHLFKEEVWQGIESMLAESRNNSVNSEKECFWVMGGEEPTEADATVFGFVISVLVCEAAPESRELVKGFPVVMEYAERIHRVWFPDYEMW